MRSQELQSKPKKWPWSSTQGEDGKVLGKIWKAINATKQILLENHICTQAEDRWADRDSFGCQQVSHICTSSPGTLPPSQRLPQLPAPLIRSNNGPWTLDGGPEPTAMPQLQGVCADSPPPKKGSTNTSLNHFFLFRHVWAETVLNHLCLDVMFAHDSR